MPVRCAWVPPADALYVAYHDREWGVPVHDDRHLFEMLVLEGAQAGLSWATVLHKRERYREVFDGFDPAKIALYDESKIAHLLQDPGIIRNRRKIQAAVDNARACQEHFAEQGSLARALWAFVDGVPVTNAWRTHSEVPAQTEQSRAMSGFLLERGFKFVGPTICYAFMQAVGMVNDHTTDCFRYHELQGGGVPPAASAGVDPAEGAGPASRW